MPNIEAVAATIFEAAKTEILPGSVLVDEEAVAENPKPLQALRTEPVCWLVDPIDGTINFAHGVPLFATMVPLVVAGETVCGWISDPFHEAMAMVEKRFESLF